VIVDKLSNARSYSALGGGIVAALDYLRKTDFSALAPGRYELDGDKLYALVQQYDSKPREQGRLEAHRRYIDVQYVAEGAERMGYGNVDDLKVVTEYDGTKDALFLQGESDFVVMHAGSFAVFWPQDAHMPGIALQAPQRVKKVVLKVLKNL